jgi:hexulose-6-phosphate isomerase
LGWAEGNGAAEFVRECEEEMKKAISIWAFPESTEIRQAMSLAKQIGFDGIELALNETGELALDWGVSQVSELRRYADRVGIEITSLAIAIGWQYPVVTRDEEMAARAKEVVRKGLHFAGALEIDAVLTVPCTVSDDLPYDEAYARGVEIYKELGKMGEAYGVCACVENVWNKFLLSPLEFARFLDDVGHKFVGAYFDVGNVLVFGYPQQWIRILGQRVKKVHVKDFKTQIGNAQGFTTLLNGDVDFPAVMQALRDVGYDDCLVAEVGPVNPACPQYLLEQTSAALDCIMRM